MEPLTAAQADAIYDVLVSHAGAPDSADDPYGPRFDFVTLQTDGNPPTEYRFMGSLGFGGKFWRNRGRWYVTAYPETTRAQPQLHEVINRTNAALDALRSQCIEAA